MIVEDLVVRVSADTDRLKKDFIDVERVSRTFASGLSTAFDQVLFKGKGLDDVLRQMALRLSSSAFNAAFRPIEQGLGNFVSGLFSSALPFQKGGVFGAGSVTPFANGGVVGGPTLFPMGRGGIGLMGEAGPEAVLPLARGSNGRLGVASGSSGGPVTVNVSISTPDVDGFSRARGRVAADLARAVDRGRRHL